MSHDSESAPRFARVGPQETALAGWLRRGETFVLALGVAAVVLRQSLGPTVDNRRLSVGALAVSAMALLSASLVVRYFVSRTRKTYLRANRFPAAISAVWLLGLAAVAAGAAVPGLGGDGVPRALAAVRWSEAVLGLRAIVEVILLTREAAAGGANPSVILVATFALLISAGTVLLCLPMSRGPSAPADEPFADRVRIALFTSTSASCVTGLVVVDTGGRNPYWSRFGQCVILGLIQTGGLGIMTLGAFFAVASGRHMPIREHATIRDMLETEKLSDVGQLVFHIAAFTLGAELLGAALLWGLWPELPPLERAYYAVFHSVSAFCNAGFALTDNSFVGYGGRWQVLFVVTGLIIVGGLGFGVLRNVANVLRGRIARLRARCGALPGSALPAGSSPPRTSLTSHLVLLTTLALLAAGTLGYFLLERNGHYHGDPLSRQFGDAWFQSVTFRTAGFNTVDHVHLQPATKLFAVILMFIGASPGSTGGGVKTTCFAVAVLGVLSILRGRMRVEFAGRTIPDVLVNRALTIISLGLVTLMATTLLLTLIERNELRFLDHLFEAASACGTVGVSADVTKGLKPASHLVLTAAMFSGALGPLTLLVALAGRMRDARYEFPVERVTLG